MGIPFARIRPWFVGALRGVCIACIGVACVALGFGYALVRQARRELPDIPQLHAAQLAQDSVVVDRYGQRISMLRGPDGHRAVVAFHAIHPFLRMAVVASEDARFWSHDGLDAQGILRASTATLMSGGTKVQGGSTIPQQVLKLTMLGQRPSLLRKVSEALLARRFDSALTKEEILSLYLNSAAFPGGNSGVEAAARDCFGHGAASITLAEAALLIGALPAPSKYSPFCAPDLARERQRHVLRRMVVSGSITTQQADAAAIDRVHMRLADEGVPTSVSASVLTAVDARTSPVSGVEVGTTIDLTLQIAAVRALHDGLRAYARARGEHRGPRFALAPTCSWRADLHALRATLRAWGHDEMLVYDFADVPSSPCPPSPCRYGGRVFRRASPRGRASAVVTAVDHASVTVDLGDRTGVIRRSTTTWTKQSLVDLAPVGAIIDVELPATIPHDPGTAIEVTIIPRPVVDGAVVAMDPRSREILALVGGVESVRGSLHRATAARRPIGSTVKPFVFATALAAHVLDPLSEVHDVPIRSIDPWRGDAWQPVNWYPGNVGAMLLPEAMARSVNTVAVAATFAAGVDRLAVMLEAIGVPRVVTPKRALALGAIELTPLDLANAYAVFASGGFAAPPKVLADDGANNSGVHVFTPSFAALMDWFLAQPIEHSRGTARRLRTLNLRIRGKTGTTNDAHDAWFVGYTPELLVAVWVGYDRPRRLRTARGDESGGSLAVPIAQAIFAAARTMIPLTPWEPVAPDPPTFVEPFTPEAPAFARAAFAPEEVWE